MSKKKKGTILKLIFTDPKGKEDSIFLRFKYQNENRYLSLSAERDLTKKQKNKVEHIRYIEESLTACVAGRKGLLVPIVSVGSDDSPCYYNKSILHVSSINDALLVDFHSMNMLDIRCEVNKELGVYLFLYYNTVNEEHKLRTEFMCLSNEEVRILYSDVEFFDYMMHSNKIIYYPFEISDFLLTGDCCSKVERYTLTHKTHLPCKGSGVEELLFGSGRVCGFILKNSAVEYAIDLSGGKEFTLSPVYLYDEDGVLSLNRVNHRWNKLIISNCMDVPPEIVAKFVMGSLSGFVECYLDLDSFPTIKTDVDHVGSYLKCQSWLGPYVYTLRKYGCMWFTFAYEGKPDDVHKELIEELIKPLGLVGATQSSKYLNGKTYVSIYYSE